MTDHLAQDPRAEYAPEAYAALRRLLAELWGAADPRLLELARLRIAQLLGNERELDRHPEGAPRLAAAEQAALAAWPTSEHFGPADRAALALTEQFVIDVAGVDDALRASSAEALGAEQLGGLTMALWLLDYGQRSQMALDRLFPGAPVTGVADVAGDPAAALQLGSDFDALLKATARLDTLDMVTTELVRLRGARRHNCRICQSTRSVAALEGGADEAMFDKIDRYETSDLDEDHKVALRLTDALTGQPKEIDADLVAQVRSAFTAGQVAELVLDVMRNSAQKVAVTLGGDAPHVEEGVELYALADDGDVVFLGAPV